MFYNLFKLRAGNSVRGADGKKHVIRTIKRTLDKNIFGLWFEIEFLGGDQITMVFPIPFYNDSENALTIEQRIKRRFPSGKCMEHIF